MMRLLVCILIALAAGCVRVDQIASKPSLIPPPIPGDLDYDDDVDILDFHSFALCFTGPNKRWEQRCESADLDYDFDVDLNDLSIFMRHFTGP